MSTNLHDRMKLTLTGVDAFTPLEEAKQLLKEYPKLEFGVLYAHDPEDRPRYPHISSVLKIVSSLHHCALHVCGKRGMQDLWDNKLDEITTYVRRIQVNGTLTPYQVRALCEAYPRHEIITQHNFQNLELSTMIVTGANHELLVDCSGGTGRAPEFWRRPTKHKPVGFAGGLNAKNLLAELLKIQAVADSPMGWGWWIDMESGVRDDGDLFDIGKAREICELIWPF